MSAWVWHNSPAAGAELLVLLAVADSAEDDGTNAWPSVATLAAKVRMSDRTVQRHLHALERTGQITVERQVGGTPGWRSDRRPNRYAVVMKDPPRGDNLSPGDNLTPGTGCQMARDGVTNGAPRGDIAVSPKTSRDIQETSKRESAAKPAAPSTLPLSWFPPALRAEKNPPGGFDIEAETTKFRAWHAANKPTSYNWDASWETWVSRHRPTDGNGSGGTKATARAGTGLAAMTEADSGPSEW